HDHAGDRCLILLLYWSRLVYSFFFVFFFSSRRRHTRCYRDWSSDVCSSDLSCVGARTSRSPARRLARPLHLGRWRWPAGLLAGRSEERRVGKECRSRWAAED